MADVVDVVSPDTSVHSQRMAPSAGFRAHLDHAASTPPHPEVLAAVPGWLVEYPANPTGQHAAARAAKHALEEARERIATCLGAAPDEVVLTGGGTESDNLAVKGAVRAARVAGRPDGVVVSAIEHRAVLGAAARVAAEGSRVDLAPVTHGGCVDLDRLADLVDASTALVSVMAVNNEVGTRQPVAAVAEILRSRAPGALLHTDAVQAPTWVTPSAFAAADLVSVTGHKVGGLRGTGALVWRGRADLVPEIEGGGQERGRRAGTPDVVGALALALALELTEARRDAEAERLAALRDRLVEGVLAAVPDVVVHGDAAARVPGFAPLGVADVESDALIVVLDRAGVDAAAGSSCASGATEPSHVLTAMGVDPRTARGALRLTLGHTTTEAEVEHLVAVLPPAVAMLRGSAS